MQSAIFYVGRSSVFVHKCRRNQVLSIQKKLISHPLPGLHRGLAHSKRKKQGEVYRKIRLN